MGDLTSLPLLEGSLCHTLRDTVMHWHYKQREQKRKYFPLLITKCIRCEMNAMVNEQQQAVDLTQHTGFHWNCCISPSPGTDINDSKEQMVFYLCFKKGKKKLLEFGRCYNFHVNKLFAETVHFFTDYLDSNYLKCFGKFLLTSFVQNLNVG